MKVHYVDIGIVSIIRQRLKDIEIQRWLSEIINNGVTRSPKPREIISLVFTFPYITHQRKYCATVFQSRGCLLPFAVVAKR